MSQDTQMSAAQRGAAHLCAHCGNLTPTDNSLILCQDSTYDLAMLVREASEKIGARTTVMLLPDVKIHGEEPPAPVAGAMLAADVIFCLTPMSLAHTQARFQATETGSRYLSLPDYSMAVMESPSLLADFKSLFEECDALGKVLDTGKTVRIQTDAGTDVTFSIEGRMANRAPGYVDKIGDLGSPPDAEVNVAPIETTITGRAVIDGSIPVREIGLLKEPVTLIFKDGAVVDVEGEPAMVETVNTMFDKVGPKARIVGEFGIGLNPLAKLCGIMLEDEGTRGTVHLGIGSNATIGGLNHVAFHVDFIMRDAKVSVDGRAILDGDNILVS